MASSRDASLGREGYALRIGRVFAIDAHGPAGAFYGGRTLLQLARPGKPIAAGTARDVPRMRERGLMIDDGRAFYPRAWLEAEVRHLADLKLNLLHLHFSDDQGFRIQSDTHPEIVSDQHLTKDDVRALLRVARRDHVTIVPELDSPGHLTAALAKHPELQLTDLLGQRQPDKLDVTLPAARRFISDLVGEYLALFGGGWWHMGSDEYLGIASTPLDYDRYPQLAAYARAKYGPGANGQDAVLDFVKGVEAQVRGAGERLRVWSDGINGGSGAVALDPSTAVEWWENLHSPAPSALAAQGHDVLNVGWWPLYYVTGGPLTGLRASEQDAYEDWEPWRFEGPYTLRWFAGRAGGTPLLLDPADPHMLGATLAVWNDDPAAAAAKPAAVAAGTAPRLRVLAQLAWGSPRPAPDYATFAPMAAAVDP